MGLSEILRSERTIQKEKKNEIRGRWVRPPCRMGDENAVKDTFEWKN